MSGLKLSVSLLSWDPFFGSTRAASSILKFIRQREGIFEMLDNLTAFLCRIDHYREPLDFYSVYSRRLSLQFIVSEPRISYCVCFPMDASVPQWDRYRAHALECLYEAQAVKDRDLNEVFHRLAMWWVILSHEVEDDPRPTNSQRLPFARKPVTGAEPETLLSMLRRADI
jgi:hypothetical protein